MLNVPVPQPDSLVSLLREAHVSQFVPKNKTIIVDESLTKEDEQGKDLLLARVKDSSTEYFFTLLYTIKSSSFVFKILEREEVTNSTDVYHSCYLKAVFWI